ncbi:MAG: alkaline phosphatase family protein [Pseudomonadota bacterium]
MAAPPPLADRVLVVVFDGLRPDLIAGRMPHLHGFADSAVWFTEASSVFPSMTRVATTATATGCWPGAHGVVGNMFHAPALKPGAPLDTSNRGDLETAERAYGGIITARTLGERLAAAGKRLGVVHAGSVGSAYLLNHRAPQLGHWTVSAHSRAASLTPDWVARAEAEIGPLPDTDELPRLGAIAFAEAAARALALAEDGPDVAVVWFPEPDTSFHYLELGSEKTAMAMANVDAAFARLVEAARSGPRGARTAIIAMSDHGQISINRVWEIGEDMRADGLSVSHRPDGHGLALTRGVSGELRCLTGDHGALRAAADWLMGRPEIGMIFARDDLVAELPGTLPLSAVHLTHPRTAELKYICRSDSGPDHYGLPGSTVITAGPPVGGGMHGGLNRHELNTVLMVAAPGAPGGRRDDRPCGLIDIAPTVLSLLGLPAEGAQGAALPIEPMPAAVETDHLHAAREGFEQHLTRKVIDGRAYLHEGGRG